MRSEDAVDDRRARQVSGAVLLANISVIAAGASHGTQAQPQHDSRLVHGDIADLIRSVGRVGEEENVAAVKGGLHGAAIC